MANLHKFFALPQNNEGVIISVGNNPNNLTILLTAITGPQTIQVSVPLQDSAIEELYCGKCSHYKKFSDALKDIQELNPGLNRGQLYSLTTSTMATAKQCQGRAYFGTEDCYAGYTDAKKKLEALQVATINTPYLAWTNSWGVGSARFSLNHKWSLRGFKDDTLNELQPYRIANVYSDAKICWGSRVANPQSHSRAIAQYFMSEFNYDLMTDTQGSIKTSLEMYKFEDHTDWRSAKAVLALENALVTTSDRNKSVGVIYTQAPKYLEIIPKKHLYGTSDNLFGIGWVQSLPNKQFLVRFRKYAVLASSLTPRSKLTPLGIL